MGQKCNPISNRLGIVRGWDSNWFGGKNFGDNILEDSKIRKYLNARLAKASISKIVIERTLKLVTVTVCTARPGIIIGKGGQEVDKLKEELKKLTDKDVQINIYEVKRPELDAVIVSNNIARQIEGKIAYRRAIKTAIANTSSLRVRKSPSKDAAILSLLAEGDKMEAIGNEGEWVKVEFSDGDIGYVSAEYVSVEDKIGEGETIESINAKEAAQKKEKAEAEAAAKAAKPAKKARKAKK